MTDILFAGAATRDISPLKPLFLVGYPHVQRISTGIHDPLLATALCLRQGAEAVLLVAVDILFINPPTARRLRKTLATATGIAEESVFISCSHTHSGPVTHSMIAWESDPIVPRPDPDYMRHFEDGILQAALDATQHLQPAQWAWTSTPVSGVGGYRLAPEGPADRDAQILALRTVKDNRWLAVSLTYCMHPTVLHEDSFLISADFPAYTRLQLREQLGPDTAILYHMGPSGNQSPRYAVKAQTFAEAERLGRRLGAGVADALLALPDSAFSHSAQLQGRIVTTDLPRRQLPPREEAERLLKECRQTYEQLKANGAPHGPVRTAECAVFGAEETVTLARAQAEGRIEQRLKDFLPAEVQILKIGSRSLVGFPAELFVEYGLALREKSQGTAFGVSLVNGDLQGYIVTPEAARAGGYEAANSLFDPAAGEQLLRVALDALSALTTR
jgi:neutral ceramidase